MGQGRVYYIGVMWRIPETLTFDLPRMKGQGAFIIKQANIQRNLVLLLAV